MHASAPHGVTPGFARSIAGTETVLAAYEAYARQDLAGLLDLYAPDVELYASELLPWGGRFRGVREAKRFLALLLRAVDGHVTVEQLVPAAERVVVMGRSIGRVRATDVRFDLPAVHVWTVRERRVAAVEFYVDTPAMLAALRAGERRGEAA